MIQARNSRVAILVALILGAVGPFAAGAHAQLCKPMSCPAPPPIADSRREGHLVSFGVNTAIGALTGGIGNSARGGSFWRGFVIGAGGGAIVYAGKRITAERFSGAGLLARETAAVGTSIVANAATNRGAFERLVLPIGPARLYLTRDSTESSRLKIDLPAIIIAAYYGVHSDTELDLGLSFSAGAPVFVDRADGMGTATESIGVIRLPNATDENTRAHEQVHVSQTDFTFLAWSEPLERRVFSRYNATRTLRRYVDFRLDGFLLLGLNAMIPHASRPWEQEADFLSRDRQETWSRPYPQFRRSTTR